MPIAKSFEELDTESGFKDFPSPEETDAFLSEALISPFSTGEMNSILRGEISAVEAYQQAMEKFSSVPDISRLRMGFEEHRQMVAYWKSQLRNEGQVVSDDAGVWGKMVSAFMSAAKALGENATISALIEVEEHALKQYEALLAREVLYPAQQDYIRMICIPQQQRHIANLSSLHRQ